jgi:YegS/Rv2252/BmrU family lipid kinase
MKRPKIIVNPISSRGRGGRSIATIEELLRGHQLDFDLVCTERPWHAAELARSAAEDGFRCVVAVGGDGTANEVLNGLMWAKTAGIDGVTMGILTVGRGNDFGFGMGVPADLEAGCRALAQGHRRPVDVGRVEGGLYPEGRYFGNGVGIGFDAVVGFVAQKMTRLHGFVSYLVAALKTIFLYYRAPTVRIEYGDRTVIHPALMVSVMNGRRMGGGFMMAPNAAIDDGQFDLCIAGQVSRMRILALIPRFMNGSQATHPAVSTDRTNRVVVTAVEGVLPAHADGETLCTDGTRLALDLLPRQIEMIYAPPEHTS